MSRVVLVTGASSGIGAATVRLFEAPVRLTEALRAGGAVRAAVLGGKASKHLDTSVDLA